MILLSEEMFVPQQEIHRRYMDLKMYAIALTFANAFKISNFTKLKDL